MHPSYIKWLEDGQPKIICACGCEGEIIIKSSHKYDGIPKYINGHNEHNGFKGKKHSEETKRKISESEKGKILSEETKRKMSEAKREISKETRKKISKIHKGKPKSEEHKRKISEAIKLLIGDKSSNWKGGISTLNNIIRNSDKYKEWRFQIFGRDNFTCQCCNIRGTYLEVHHIKSRKEIIKEYNITKIEDALNCEILWDLNNGITYCLECHNKLKKKGGKLAKIKEDLISGIKSLIC